LKELLASQRGPSQKLLRYTTPTLPLKALQGYPMMSSDSTLNTSEEDETGSLVMPERPSHTTNPLPTKSLGLPPSENCSLGLNDYVAWGLIESALIAVPLYAKYVYSELWSVRSEPDR
jgi:hypothetical protein